MFLRAHFTAVSLTENQSHCWSCPAHLRTRAGLFTPALPLSGCTSVAFPSLVSVGTKQISSQAQKKKKEGGGLLWIDLLLNVNASFKYLHLDASWTSGHLTSSSTADRLVNRFAKAILNVPVLTYLAICVNMRIIWDRKLQERLADRRNSWQQMLSLALVRNTANLLFCWCSLFQTLCKICNSCSCSPVNFASHGSFEVVIYFFFRVWDKRHNLVYSDRLLLKRGPVLLLLWLAASILTAHWPKTGRLWYLAPPSGAILYLWCV